MVLVAVQLSVPGLYLPPVLNRGRSDSAPDNHFVAGPYCRVTVSCGRSVGDAGGYPLGVRAWSVSPTRAHKEAVALSAPDNHLTSGPYRRVVVPVSRHVNVLMAVQMSVLGLYLPPVSVPNWPEISAPDDHFAAGPHCGVSGTCTGREGGADRSPSVGAGIVSPAVVQIVAAVKAAPDDHFAARPDYLCPVRAEGATVVLIGVQMSQGGVDVGVGGLAVGAGVGVDVAVGVASALAMQSGPPSVTARVLA